MKVHAKKLSGMLSLEMNVDERIQNISSYHLTFFQKLALCRGLQFALPSRIDNKEVLASFEKTYHVIKQNLSDDKKELTELYRAYRAVTTKGLAEGYKSIKETEWHCRYKTGQRKGCRGDEQSSVYRVAK